MDGSNGQIQVMELAAAARDTGAGKVRIPIRQVAWMDERQNCIRVLAFVHEAVAPDLIKCPQYRAGNCTRGGVCAFHEDAGAEVWRKAAGWKFDPASGYVVPESLWAAFGLAVCDERA
jgi:hypothetical protein